MPKQINTQLEPIACPWACASSDPMPWICRRAARSSICASLLADDDHLTDHSGVGGWEQRGAGPASQAKLLGTMSLFILPAPRWKPQRPDPCSIAV